MLLLLLKHTRKLLVRSLLSRDQALARWRQSKFILAANDWVRRGDLGGCAICSVGFKSYDPAIFLVILHSNQYTYGTFGGRFGEAKRYSRPVFLFAAIAPIAFSEFDTSVISNNLCDDEDIQK